jgi:hypothetical protein
MRHEIEVEFDKINGNTYFEVLLHLWKPSTSSSSTVLSLMTSPTSMESVVLKAFW